MRLHYNVDIHNITTCLNTIGIIFGDGALGLNEEIKDVYKYSMIVRLKRKGDNHEPHSTQITAITIIEGEMYS